MNGFVASGLGFHKRRGPEAGVETDSDRVALPLDRFSGMSFICFTAGAQPREVQAQPPLEGKMGEGQGECDEAR